MPTTGYTQDSPFASAMPKLKKPQTGSMNDPAITASGETYGPTSTLPTNPIASKPMGGGLVAPTLKPATSVLQGVQDLATQKRKTIQDNNLSAMTEDSKANAQIGQLANAMTPFDASRGDVFDQSRNALGNAEKAKEANQINSKTQYLQNKADLDQKVYNIESQYRDSSYRRQVEDLKSQSLKGIAQLDMALSRAGVATVGMNNASNITRDMYENVDRAFQELHDTNTKDSILASERLASGMRDLNRQYDEIHASTLGQAMKKIEKMHDNGSMNTLKGKQDARGIVTTALGLISESYQAKAVQAQSMVDKVKMDLERAKMSSDNYFRQAQLDLERDKLASTKYAINPLTGELYDTKTGETKKDSDLRKTYDALYGTGPTVQDVAKVCRSGDNLQCGMVSNDYASKAFPGYDRMGDSLDSKIASIKSIGVSPTPVAGGLFALDRGDFYGHTGVITQVYQDGSFDVAEANRKGTANGPGTPVLPGHYSAEQTKNMMFSVGPNAKAQGNTPSFEEWKARVTGGSSTGGSGTLLDVVFGPKASEGQKSAYKFGLRMSQSEQSLQKMEEDYLKSGSLKEYFTPRGENTPNMLKSTAMQQFEQSKRDWINANLRRESGAVIADSEFDNANLQYFPQPGDDDATIKQKRYNRWTATYGTLKEAGRSENGTEIASLYRNNEPSKEIAKSVESSPITTVKTGGGQIMLPTKDGKSLDINSFF